MVQESTASTSPTPRTLGPGKEFEVFYDGECPLCAREIRMLERLDRNHSRLVFTDIAAPIFSARTVDISFADLMAEIHGRKADGSLVKGVEVFRQLYSAVGFGPLVAITRLWGLRHLLDFGYVRFARNRLKLTGRCTPESCAIPADK